MDFPNGWKGHEFNSAGASEPKSEKLERFEFFCESIYCRNPNGTFIGKGYIDVHGFPTVEEGEYPNESNGKRYHQKCLQY